MDVDIYDEKGKSLKFKKGELVCKSSFPSKPIYFWNDKNNIKYKKSYFSKYKNIWHHGDYAEFTKNEGIIIHGRSDTTLNSGGVRIGTAEIYRVVENIKEIEECLVTEKILKDDTAIVMFIKIRNNIKLNKKIIKKIQKNIKNLLSPKHIPKIILQVKDIPKTKSGKIVELAIKKIINGEKVENISSLSNPECLKEYKNRKELNI